MVQFRLVGEPAGVEEALRVLREALVGHGMHLAGVGAPRASRKSEDYVLVYGDLAAGEATPTDGASR